MKQTIILLFVLSFSCSFSQTENDKEEIHCSYDNDVSSLGIGLVIPTEKIQLFNDTTLKDTLLNTTMEKYYEVPMACPKFYKPDYGIMHFVCLYKTKRYYKVLINFDQVKFIPNTKDYTFLTWKDYIMQSNGISGDDGTGTTRKPTLYTEPDYKSDIVDIEEADLSFCPLEMKGDWIKVRYDCQKEPGPCSKKGKECEDPVTGWIRWKDKNKLLIAIFLLC